MAKVITLVFLVVLSLVAYKFDKPDSKVTISSTHKIMVLKGDVKIILNYPSGKQKLIQTYIVKSGDTTITGEKVFHENGKLYMIGEIKEFERNGLWQTYYDDGKQWSETNFVNGVTHGKTITWYKNGQLRFTGYFKNGEKSGEWIWYDKDGKLNKKIELGTN
jgi:antitoxin component YwqK of YwqJK toxin-antitoxin module